MILNMLLAFITSLFTAITVRTPAAAWPTVGITGMLGWAARDYITHRNIPDLVAVVTGAAVIGLMAELLARLQKQPVTVYIASGIIPLVPGTSAYNSMLAFLDRQIDVGILLAFKAFLTASYLAAGLAVAPLFVRSFRSLTRRSRLPPS